MTFKSLIIFALIASVGHVMAAPLTGKHSNARAPCHGIWCARGIIGNGNSGPARRFAQFDNPSVTLGTPTPVYPNPTTLPVEPSSTPSVDDIPTGTPSGNSNLVPSSTVDGIPQVTNPAAGDPVVVTVVSTVFLTLTNPAGSLPTQSSSPPNGTVSSIPPVDPYLTNSGDSVPISEPNGIFTSSQNPLITLTQVEPTATPFPTVIDLGNGSPGSSSDPTDQSTPSPTPTPTSGGIVFLPPS